MDNSYRTERWSNAAGGKAFVDEFPTRPEAQEAAAAMIALGHTDTVVVAVELDTTTGSLQWSLDYETLLLLPTLSSDGDFDLKVEYDGGTVDVESTELAIRTWTGQKVFVNDATTEVQHRFFDRNGNILTETTFVNGQPVTP